ncbi:CDP-alcohol phosphatidyltransferase family protein [Cereibacter sp. SYSU M97828]|nr:CDP-alcohol phosphatidyltransferase family protein [Cereibacter flavus]
MSLRDPAFAFGLSHPGPRVRFAAAGAGMAAALWFAGGVVPAAIFAAVASVVVAGASRYPHPRIGFCNVLTFARLALACLLASRIGDEPGWPEVFVAVAALATDGFDGWAARRTGLISRFGARFDMEVDSGLALVLACLAAGRLGGWVMVLGVMRYLWLAAASLVPRLNGTLPDSMARKTVCVIQIAALIAAICPAVPPLAAIAAASFAGLLLIWSFGRDALWLLRRG